MWKVINNYPNYQVSDKGEIKNIKTGRLLKGYVRNDGYTIVQLTHNKNKCCCYLHRLVAEAFISNPNNLPQVNHIDEDKTNNAVSNLSWTSAKDNANWGTRNKRVGLGHTKAIIQLDLNDNILKEWESATEVERYLGFNHSNISKCCKGIYPTAYKFKWRFRNG